MNINVSPASIFWKFKNQKSIRRLNLTKFQVFELEFFPSSEDKQTSNAVTRWDFKTLCQISWIDFEFQDFAWKQNAQNHKNPILLNSIRWVYGKQSISLYTYMIMCFVKPPSSSFSDMNIQKQTQLH